MVNYKSERAKRHKVTHEFSGKNHFFKVESESGKTYNVSVQVSCDCKYSSLQGVTHNKMCSHSLAVLNEIAEKGNIRIMSESKGMIQIKRNNCLQLVKASNRKINEIRYSSSESKAHIDKKKEICEDLLKQGKHFVCEAIFNSGGRADILVLEDFMAIEVVHSESDISIGKKMLEYPDGIKLKVVRC